MRHETAGHTLQPTALEHEAWFRLGGDNARTFQNRVHFFGSAAEAMRRILIERSGRRMAAKRSRHEARHAVPTAKQWWAYARAWLTVELRSGVSR